MRILIADDHPIVRRGLRQIIEAEPEHVVVGEAANGDEVLALAQSVEWDLAILDYAMPGRCGLELLGDFRERFPGKPVLILSMYEEELHAAPVLAAGGAGFISKESAARDLGTAIRRVAEGGRYVSEAFGEALASGVAQERLGPPHQRLSDREYRVMWLLASGAQVNDIARDLQLHPSTVSTYRARVLSKLGVDNNAELVRYAIRQQLIS